MNPVNAVQDKLRLKPADDSEAYPPISTYAAVGHCRTVALISRQGSVDWLCLRRCRRKPVCNHRKFRTNEQKHARFLASHG